jgi:hypothetical protein
MEAGVGVPADVFLDGGVDTESQKSQRNFSRIPKKSNSVTGVTFSRTLLLILLLPWAVLISVFAIAPANADDKRSPEY